ncbi:50S ribosomal protein L29 [Candidatus Woesearchaeota archaeon]|nr:50S ribosomal protein L29 [Candidatus Woesearchaeota archaeon]
MKFSELKTMGREELEKKMEDLKLELMKDYAQISAGTPPKNPGMIKERKKTIARIKSLLQSEETTSKK